MKRKKLYTILYILAIFLISIRFCSYVIEKETNGKTFSDVTQIKRNKVGLVLGTSSKLTTGQPNPYYTHRIGATIALFKAGKIDYVLVSGDNGTKYYNEPSTYKKDLIAGGIPENKIFLDYAGFRTLDSMVRAKEIFGLDSVTAISQKFHNERALYLAKHFEIDALAFNANEVKGRYGLKTNLREYLARAKASIDILFNVKPKFLGKKIDVISF